MPMNIRELSAILQWILHASARVARVAALSNL
jgi:hypothetical protein